MKKITTIFLILIIVACGNSQNNEEFTTLKPGDFAPNFNLKNVDGDMISPENFPDAKGFIIIFTANTCPYAQSYEDRIIALSKKYQTKGFPLIAINANNPELSSGDTFQKMQEKAKSKGFNFPYLYDEGQIVTNQYGAKVTPHVFLLKKVESQYQVVYTGAIDNDTEFTNPDRSLFVEDAIANLNAKKEIKVPTTKAIGCTVKRT